MSAPSKLSDCEALLIECGSEKRRESCRAEDLYVSRYFQLKRRVAELSELPWAILSAQHGVLQPNVWTSPYELNAEEFTKFERREWAAGVALNVFEWQREISRVAIIAGESYSDPLSAVLAALDVEVVLPCRGMGIGHQMEWLRAYVAARA